MENKQENILNNFLNDDQKKQADQQKKDAKKVIVSEREGLIERIDKTFIVEDGRQLLREQY